VTSPDRLVTVDWSAAATPREGVDSIWVCLLEDDTPALANPRTRREAEALLTELCGRSGRTLLAADVALAYPAGTAQAADLCRLPGAAAWNAICEHLETELRDGLDNRNNRWEVAAALNARFGSNQFWGAPVSRSSAWLPVRKPARPPLPWFRASESALRASGMHPASPWQLLGVGSVGSQALTFIPVMQRLRRSMPGRVLVWPMETGMVPDPWNGAHHRTVVTESWTTLAPADEVDAVDHQVRDARQVVALARFLRRQLDAGAPLFQPPAATPHLDVVNEEGWVLGVV